MIELEFCCRGVANLYQNFKATIVDIPGKVGGNSEYTAELGARADKWIAEQSELYGVDFPNDR